MPDRELALRSEDAHKRLSDVGAAVAMDQGEERHLRTVGIPEREGRVAFRSRIGIADLRRGGHGVVERCIEDRAVIGIVRFNLDPSELLVPGLVSLRLDCFDIPARQLLVQIGFGFVDRRGGDAHTRQDR